MGTGWGTPSRTGQLRRTTPMKRTATTHKTASRAGGVSADTAAIVIARATIGGVLSCELCGEPLTGQRGYDWALHHRRPRDGRPDSHTAQNQLAVHGTSNVDACHGIIHANADGQSTTNGWLISRNARPVIDPLTVPVLVDNGKRWVYLTADGRYLDCTEGVT